MDMMWSDKAFGIWMGDAGRDASRFADGTAGIGGQAFERTLTVRDECTDVAAAPRAGFVARTISAIADRTQLPRIARG
jgi:hypothetical protein